MSKMSKSDPRPNPAQANRWNAWRYPTDGEIARGRAAHDMYWIGASMVESEAAGMLPRGEDGQHAGQLQYGVDGEVKGLG